MMSKPYFQFKQFTVRHDKCAMKVGTDGVLLGAWADVTRCGTLLDVGTGTGLIALMLAQRSPALVDAIDIDADACRQARDNAALSPFAGRIRVTHVSLADFTPVCRRRYDLIVSNPPYFVDSLKCPDPRRRTARHSDTLSMENLLRDGRRLLSPQGRIAVILPYDRKRELLAYCCQLSLFLSKETAVIPVEGLPPKRLLAEVTPVQPPSLVRNELILQTAGRDYTEDYISLTKAFYLKM